MAGIRNRVILIVRDGWGYSEHENGNAVRLANTPNHDSYLANYPWTLLKCTGNAVGVPEGTQGGSEPGHLTMGAGRIVWQPYEDINRQIANGDFFENAELVKAVERCVESKRKLHLMGLFSDQGIHGTTEHLYALLELAERRGVQDVYIHCFLDGRDVPERSADEFFKETKAAIDRKGVGEIASIVGRYYAMDRDTNWERTKRAYDLLTQGEGFPEKDIFESLENAYDRGDETDYYIRPIVMTDEEGRPVATMDDGDSVIFWNFRSDRARQITYALTLENFDKFPREKYPDVHFVCMSGYDKNLSLPVAFPQHSVEKTLGWVMEYQGLRQLRIAETEKYAHVTFFFNSQVEAPFKGEDRIMIPSPKVPSYEEKPEMSAYEITEKLIPAVREGIYDLIVVNYANGDLVGHSANLDAGVKACESVDECVGRVVGAAEEKGYTVLLTGDHGNIETMFYPDGEPNPSHGTNPVPLIVIGPERVELREDMGLSGIAPTILRIMGLEKPGEMTGESILGEL